MSAPRGRARHTRPLAACPSCGSRELERARVDLTYVRAERPSLPHEAVIHFYLEHLFGSPRFRLTQDLCRGCALLFANPTFTDEEARRLYGEDSGPAQERARAALLANGGRDPSPAPEAVARSAALRARWVHRAVERDRRVRGPSARVLDHGGKRGALLAEFVREGARAYLADLAAVGEPAPGVERVEDPARAAPYDVILLCHVLEHVMEPRPLLERLRSLVAPDGVLYVEVPCDLDRALVDGDPGPLTHVNVFGPSSLHNALCLAGWKPLRRRLVRSSYEGIPLPSLAWVAAPGERAERPPAPHRPWRLAAELLRLRAWRRLDRWGLPGLARMDPGRRVPELQPPQ